MSLARKHPTTSDGVRDPRADFIDAHLEELAALRGAGLTERANEVVAVLRQLGYEVDKVPTGTKERAVADADLEKAVPAEAPKRRRTTKAE